MDDPKSNHKLVLLFLLSSIYFPAGFLCQIDGPNHAICEEPFECGDIANITYPFWDIASLEKNLPVQNSTYSYLPDGSKLLLCGHPDFGLNCKGSVPVINISQIPYRVLQINFSNYTLQVARLDLGEDMCSPILVDTSFFDSSSFELIPQGYKYKNATLYYNCSGQLPRRLPKFSCNSSNKTTNHFWIGNNASTGPGNKFTCEQNITVPIDESVAQETQTDDALQDALGSGFPIRWSLDYTKCRNCSSYGGTCRYAVSSGAVDCDGRRSVRLRPVNEVPNRYRRSCDYRNKCRRDAVAKLPPCTYDFYLSDFYCDPGPTSQRNTTPHASPPKESQELNSRPGGASPPKESQVLISESKSRPASKEKRIILGLAFGIGFTLASILISWYCKTRHFPRGLPLNPNIEKFLQQHGSLAPKRYKYSEIKKLTKSFNEKLGQGGYGSVYKGVLPDGCPVAVKVLIEMDSNDEEFINEVASISRTSHVNIVGLLGFCYERNKRALVYEYMPNKSLDKFFRDSGTSLDMENLYKIAIGVAKGLEYLHSGCTTRIIHFDIKPQNILLDEDFCPKISDFGLAKLCKRKQSILSTLGTRGTVGYIAPEVFCRNFGGISHKSDVYSYGMMILEMAGVRELEAGRVQSSENYFPDEIYEHAITGRGTEMIDCNDSMVHVEDERSRKMFLVGFWCIQTMPSDRPPMTKVIEMFEGNVEFIQTPPKPILFNPIVLGHQFSPVHVGIEDSTEYGSELPPTSLIDSRQK